MHVLVTHDRRVSPHGAVPSALDVVGGNNLVSLLAHPGVRHQSRLVAKAANQQAGGDLLFFKGEHDAGCVAHGCWAGHSAGQMVVALAGILAINRRDMTTARQRLELARVRRRTDCETLFYLQTVLAEQRDWEAAVNMSAEAGACFEKEEASIEEELAVVRSSEMVADRRARLIARREQQLASDARMRATSWFNAAAASFNLARKDEARRYAQKVADDALFGERARTLLERIK